MGDVPTAVSDTPLIGRETVPGQLYIPPTKDDAEFGQNCPQGSGKTIAINTYYVEELIS